MPMTFTASPFHRACVTSHTVFIGYFALWTSLDQLVRRRARYGTSAATRRNPAIFTRTRVHRVCTPNYPCLPWSRGIEIFADREMFWISGGDDRHRRGELSNQGPRVIRDRGVGSLRDTPSRQPSALRCRTMGRAQRVPSAAPVAQHNGLDGPNPSESTCSWYWPNQLLVARRNVEISVPT